MIVLAWEKVGGHPHLEGAVMINLVNTHVDTISWPPKVLSISPSYSKEGKGHSQYFSPPCSNLTVHAWETV